MISTLFRRVASQQASVASLGSVALLAFLALVALEGWRGYERARTELEGAVEAHARLASEHLERTLQTVDVVFDSLVGEVGARDWAELSHSRAFQIELARIADSLPQVRSLWLVDQNGYMRAYSDGWPAPALDAFDREYYQAHALRGVTRLYPGPPLRGRFTGRSFIPVSRPIVAESYSFRGIVVAAIEPGYYLPILTARGACATCSTAFYRADGAVLFSTGDSRPLDDAVGAGISQLVVSESYPIVVAAWVPETAVRALWWAREQNLFLSSLAASLLLLWLLRRAVRANRAVLHERDRLGRLADDLAASNGELKKARAAAEAARALERSLRDEAASANRAKSQFLALMSHELRTPLNAILGFSDIIRRQADRLPPDRLADYAGDIHGSGEHLLGLINGILDLSKIEAGRFELQEERVALREIAAEAARMVCARFPEKRLEIELALPDLEIQADTQAIRQVLLNLLSNACKYSDEAGRIVVGAASHGDWLDLTVADQGCGMTAEDLKRALEPFGQAVQPLVRRSEGTGLGLNICKALVELHGGQLLIASRPGQGTTVTVRLPAARLLAPAVLADAG